MIARMSSGFAVLGDYQYLRGYSLLLGYPEVSQLNDLEPAGQVQFLTDMARLGQAVKEATGCMRVNYGIYGNLDAFLHAHIWPRYEDEREEFRKGPPFFIPVEVREDPGCRFDLEKHSGLMREIAERLAVRP